jgi:hydroxymethylpyrimidine/phosphomethylpyrimidine kinase
LSKAPPRILVIAGSDSSGGAGIQADIKTITMLGGYAMTAITAITAQNTTGVQAVQALPEDMVAAQIASCLSDIGADAVKIGMLGSPGIAHLVADRLENFAGPIVFDPVMIASSGSVLADEATIAAFGRLMSLATLTTPNLPELEVLSGVDAGTDEFTQAEAAERVLRTFRATALLGKGGHWSGGSIREEGGHEVSTDNVVFDTLYSLSEEGHWQEWQFSHERLKTRHTHGTGCTLSSAIATYLGDGFDLPEAVGKARQFVFRALQAAPGFGAGHGPLGHQAVR